MLKFYPLNIKKEWFNSSNHKATVVNPDQKVFTISEFVSLVFSKIDGVDLEDAKGIAIFTLDIESLMFTKLISFKGNEEEITDDVVIACVCGLCFQPDLAMNKTDLVEAVYIEALNYSKISKDS